MRGEEIVCLFFVSPDWTDAAIVNREIGKSRDIASERGIFVSVADCYDEMFSRLVIRLGSTMDNRDL